MPSQPGGLLIMRVIVTSEHRFLRTPDGRIWTQTESRYPAFKSYLAVFDEALIVARVRDVQEMLPGTHQADGPGVSFRAWPYYVGPWQYVRRWPTLRRTAANTLGQNDAVIMRPGQVANTLYPYIQRSRIPYGLLIVSDPADVFSPDAVRHPLRFFFRWWFIHNLRVQCARARAVAYVTTHALQRRYPPAPGAFTTSFSDVDLSEEQFTPHARQVNTVKKNYTLIGVGGLEQLYKGVDLLIQAVSQCRSAGVNVCMVWLGEGKHRREFEQQAAALGLQDFVRFRGQVMAGQEVTSELDQADLFVMPSRAEGLPRAMIEAMARGLPCIGSTVGGIPELLEEDDMFPPNRSDVLATKIAKVLGNPQRMQKMSLRNWEKAHEFQTAHMEQRKKVFYGKVREMTESWRTQILKRSVQHEERVP